MRRSLLLCLLALVATSASAGPAEDAMAHSKAFERAANARDARAMLALYAPDAQVVWPGEGQEASGTAAIEKLVAKLLAELPPDARMTLESQTAIPLAGGYIAVVGHWSESFTDAAGQRQTAEIRTSEVLETKKGRTLYVVDHASIGQPPAPETPAQPRS